MQVAGETAAFSIIARDASGIQKSLGGDIFILTWAPSVRGLSDGVAESACGHVEDLGTGEYRASFGASVAGSYLVSVHHNVSTGICLQSSNYNAVTWTPGKCFCAIV